MPSRLDSSLSHQVEKLWVAIGTVRHQIEEGSDFSTSTQDLAREAADVQEELDELREQTVRQSPVLTSSMR